jgi:peptidoglycan/xylan/chitin deacetylase (PgdA/CDA1 family)
VFFCTVLFALAIAGADIESKMAENALIIKKVPTTHKLVALTFDDGPGKKTPEILAILQDKQVKATFFVLGESVERFPQYVRDEIAAGHEVGNHGFSHAKLRNARPETVEYEIGRTEALLIKLTGEKPHLFRPPGGVYDRAVIAEARKKEYTIVLWSVDSRDWASSGEQILRTIVENTRPGSIILLHDGLVVPTALILPKVIDQLREQGYEFVTVAELLNYYEVRPKYSTE